MTLGSWVLTIALSIGCLLVLMPVVWMVLTSLKAPDQVFEMPPIWIFEPQWSNYPEVLQLVPFQRYILNTATIVGLVAVGTLLSCSFCAYGFARLKAPGRNAIFLILMATLMLPTTVTLVPTYIVFNHLGWLNTFKPLDPARVLRLRLLHLLVPAVLPGHPQGARGGGPDRRRRLPADLVDDLPAAVLAGDRHRHRCSPSWRRTTTSSDR